MNITIKKSVFTKFHSKLQIACLLIEGIDNKTNLEKAQHLLKEAETLVRLTFNRETVRNHNLLEPWAVAQEDFGGKARHYHTSVEKLLQKVLRKRNVAMKDVLTTLLRHLSLKNIVPFGVDDCVEIVGDVTFDVATGKEKRGVLKRLAAGELYYHDDKGVLGTKLDAWHNRRTNLVAESYKVLIHFDILPPITAKKRNELLREAKGLIQAFCGGEVKTFVLSEKKKSVSI